MKQLELNANSNEHLVVRYDNRKYYSYKLGKYLTLNEMISIRDLKVEKKSTGQDITEQTMFDAVVSVVGKKPGLRSEALAVLKALI